MDSAQEKKKGIKKCKLILGLCIIKNPEIGLYHDTEVMIQYIAIYCNTVNK